MKSRFLLFLFPIIATSYSQEIVFSDNFDEGDLTQWRLNETPFETGAIEIDGGGIVDGALQLGVSAIDDFWGGFSLATERSFSASAESPLTFEITRVSDDGVGTTRSAIWITDQTRSHYVFFSHNVVEGGWQFNRRIGQAGDNPTGSGTNIDAFDALDESLGSHRMKMVANGATVQLFLDDQLGAEVDFPLIENIIFEFGVYARAVGDEAIAAFDDLEIRSDLPTGFPCAALSPNQLNVFAGEQGTFTLTVPKLLLADQAAVITVSSSDPDVATIVGANGAGELQINFPRGSENVAQVQVEGVSGGLATIEIAASDPVCVANAAAVSVSSAFVRDPSFEETPRPEGVGYGEIAAWQGGSGINDGGPFGDNGSIPDRAQIAFTQGGKGLSQEISGLDPDKQYWVQFFYNARNCCGGTIGLTVNFDDEPLRTIAEVKPVGAANPYHFFSAPFQPSMSSGLLDLVSDAVGDATVLFDAVTIVERDETNIVIANPSFEASGIPPSPGYFESGLAGWTGTGGFGINVSGGGPFADNGAAPDQDLVAFIQGEASLTQEIFGFIPNAEYTFSIAANARGGNTPTLEILIDDQSIHIEELAAVGGREPYPIVTATFEASSPRHTLTLRQTAAGDQSILLDDVRITGEGSGIPCLPVSTPQFRVTEGQEAGVFSIEIPEEAVEDSPLELKVTNTNPAALTLAGADNDGVLTLNFEQGGELTATINVTALESGRGAVEIASESKPVCFTHDTVAYRVVKAPFRNPGFQSNSPTPFPTYGDIDDWARSGNAGVNTTEGPFHDNGMIPDGAQVGFIQVTNTLEQTIANLEPGVEHWLQFYYNVRNCCAGGTLDFQVLLDDAVLFEAMQVEPVGLDDPEAPYHFAMVRFTPEQSSGLFQIAVTAEGDASLLFDAFTIVPRSPNDVALINPSFEMTGAYTLEFPGYMQPTSLGGWTATGGYGVNVSGEGPFADNGTVPSQDSAVFLQGVGSSIAQTITGLTAGESYTLSYAYNARTANQPQLLVTVNGATAQDVAVDPVGADNPYHTHEFNFQATGATADLIFAQTAEGDNTVLLDNIRVTSGSAVLPCVEISPGELTLSLQQTTNIRVSVPDTLMQAHDTITVSAVSTAPGVVEVLGDSTLTFTQGGEREQIVQVRALGGGAAAIHFSNEQEGVCLSRDAVPVLISRNLVRNSSFEANPQAAGVGYGPINDWAGEGGVGLNSFGGPFHDNGDIPDRAQIALMQGAASLTQEIGAMANQPYLLQFYYNARNCCGGTIGLRVEINGEEIGSIESVEPVGYNAAAFPFIAEAAPVELRFVTTADGDATVLLDAVTVTARAPQNLVVQNPSFEASGTPPAPGYVQPNQVAGWNIGGEEYGVNVSGLGPFADNGVNPDQDYVLFLQGQTNASQTLAGLTAGTNYLLTFAYNARNGNTPTLVVAVDGTERFNEAVNPVGDANPYHTGVVAFTAAGDTAEIAFAQTVAGDHTLLLDNIALVADDGIEPPTMDLPILNIALDAGDAVITWSAPDNTWTLQESGDLETWNDSAAPANNDNGSFGATVARQFEERYFRLIRR